MKRMSFADYLEHKKAGNWRLIDVREADEYEEVHVEGAELFALSRLRNGEVWEQDEREVAVICRSGARSAMAAQMLEAKGFDEMTNVEGGTMGAISTHGEAHVVRGEG